MQKLKTTRVLGGQPSVSTDEQIAKLQAELNNLEAVGEKEYNETAQRTADANDARTQAIESRKGTSGTPGYKSRARELGIPGTLVPRCGAETREGNECKQPAGAGTDHYGQGKCKYHGGKNGTKLTHGRYSGLLNESLSDLVSHFEQDHDILNTESDIALMRSLTHRFVADYDAWLPAILAWHESFNEGKVGPSKPVKIMDLSEAHKLLDTLTKSVERERKARAANAISARDLFRILNEIGRVIETYVEDRDTLLQIREAMLTIRYA